MGGEGGWGMPRTCTVCRHLERDAIDTALVAGKESLRGSAWRFGLSASALRRHKADHLPVALLKASDAHDVARGDKLLGQVRELSRETREILAQAKASGDLRTALIAVEKIGRMLDLETKLLAHFGDQAAEATGKTVVYVCHWLNEDGEFIGETFEPPFVADGDSRTYVGALKRSIAFVRAQKAGRLLTYTLPGLPQPAGSVVGDQGKS